MRQIILLFCLIVSVFFQCTLLLTPRPTCSRLAPGFSGCFTSTFGVAPDDSRLSISLAWTNRAPDAESFCNLVSGTMDIESSEGSILTFSLVGHTQEVDDSYNRAVLTAYRFDEGTGSEVRTEAAIVRAVEGDAIRFESSGLLGLPRELFLLEIDCD